MKFFLAHPTGNANVRAVANAFADEDLLYQFYTSIACFPDSFLHYISGFSPLSEIRRRQYDAALRPYTITSPYLEAGRLISSKIGLKSLTKQETGAFSIEKVYSGIDKKVAGKLKNNTSRGVYAYEDEAFYSFREAARLNMPRFYDLPIGYWRTSQVLLAKERERWPEWVDTMKEFADSEDKFMRKDEELRLATRIFVASTFTAKTLDNYPGQLAPIEVIPYGFPPVCKNREYSSFANNRKLKLLFVGGLSQRKGIANLFSVVDKLKDYVELTIVGRKQGDDCAALNTALSKHRWIDSLSHNEILETMKQHDIFIFPSLFEGFGLVITESMSQGTPVITTERTAGPDLIKHGENGWLTEAGSTESLQQAIEEAIRRPQIIEEAGRAAMETASRRPWSQYGHELVKAVKNAASAN